MKLTNQAGLQYRKPDFPARAGPRFLGVAMLRHSRLGLRWGLPALALVPPFFAFNIAATPDPPVVDLGPIIGLYFFALFIRLVWLGRTAPSPARTS